MTSDAAAAAPATPAAPAPSPSMLDTLAAKDPPATPAAPAAPATTSAKPSWRDTLPEDIRADEGLSKFDNAKDDAERLANISRSYVNAQKMIGGDKLPKPKGPDDKEALDAVYTALGRPEKADDYKIERPKDLPPGLVIEEDGEKFLKDFAHANGWNQKQLDNAYKAFFEREARRMNEGARQQQNSYDDAMREFQREGNATETLGLAKATVQQYVDPNALAKLKAAGLDNDPTIIRMFSRIGKDLTGHQVLKGRGGETLQTGAQIQAEIDKHRSENHAALYDRSHPNHDAAAKKLDALYEQKHRATAGAAA